MPSFGGWAKRAEMEYCHPACKYFDLSSLQIVLAILLFIFWGCQCIYCHVKQLFNCRELRRDLAATLVNTLLYAFSLWLFGTFSAPFSGYEILLISVIFFIVNNLRFLRWADSACPRLEIVRGDCFNKRGFWGVALGALILAIILFWGAAGLSCPRWRAQWSRSGEFRGGTF
jgi:NhaP-type Na+/H+ or K+/H+ antiporter